MCYGWSKEFLETGKAIDGQYARAAACGEVKDLGESLWMDV